MCTRPAGITLRQEEHSLPHSLLFIQGDLQAKQAQQVAFPASLVVASTIAHAIHPDLGSLSEAAAGQAKEGIRCPTKLGGQLY